MRRKAEKRESWFKLMLTILLFMYAHDTTVIKDFKPADHLANKSLIHRT